MLGRNRSGQGLLGTFEERVSDVSNPIFSMASPGYTRLIVLTAGGEWKLERRRPIFQGISSSRRRRESRRKHSHLVFMIQMANGVPIQNKRLDILC